MKPSAHLQQMQLAGIQPGMRLAKDVYDPYGQILMRAGTVLNERQIRALRTWGIAKVAIAPAVPSPGSDLDQHPQRIAAICHLLDEQFSLSNHDHPAIQALYNLCLNRALERL